MGLDVRRVRPAPKWLVPITSLVVFAQLLTGGRFLIAGEDFGHTLTGLLVFLVAFFGVYGAMSVRPPVRAARVSSRRHRRSGRGGRSLLIEGKPVPALLGR